MNNINTFDICYIIKLDQNPTERTYFFNIEKSKLQRIELIRKISKLPINIHHPSFAQEFVVESKFCGLSNGHSIKFIYDWDQINTIPYQHKVIFSRTSPPYPFINTLCYIDENEILTETEIEKIILKYLTYNLRKEFVFNPKIIDMHRTSVKNSPYNLSTLIAFESNKFKFTYKDNSNEFNTELLEMHSRIFENITQMEDIKQLISSNKFKSIITDFSIDNYFVLNKKELTKSKLRRKISNNDEADSLSEAIICAKNEIYNCNDGTVNSDNLELKKLIQEMEYIDTLIGVYSCSTFSSTLKTDCYVNDVFTFMNDLANMEREAAYNKNIKILTARIRDKLTQKSRNVIPYIESKKVHPLKIISNLPLEWIKVNRLPLMINSPVSRIPKTPMRVLEHLTLERNFSILLDYNDIHQILVISAFEDTDVLKGQLESYINEHILDELVIRKQDEAMKEFIDSGEPSYRFNIRFENARDINELCKFLNESKESIVIFDMHGDHKDEQEGFIVINNTRVSISSLFDRVTKIPPIVIMSSCNTSEINSNSNTFSSGLLALGAFSVLGSALPIMGHESCRFITRLLVRIRLYLVEYFKREETINWSKFIHGMIKREYFTDLINHLESAGFIKTTEDKKEINDKVGIFLENYFNSNLMDGVLHIISSITNNEFERVSKEIEDNFFYAESIKYFHLGNPESIVVHKSLAAYN